MYVAYGLSSLVDVDVSSHSILINVDNDITVLSKFAVHNDV
jgi:hypothetical protein